MRNNHPIHQTNKAQFFSVDAIFSAVVFIAVILSVYGFWNYSLEKINVHEKRNELETVSRNAVNALLKTEGIPSNWSKINAALFNESNVASIGVRGSSSLIDFEKINGLHELNSTKYENIKNILGFIGPNYEFQLEIYKWNGTGYSFNTSIGRGADANSTNIVNINRYSLLNSTWIYINFKGWEKCTESRC